MTFPLPLLALYALGCMSNIVGAVSLTDRSSQSHWIDTWTAMPQLTEYTNLPPPPFNETNLVFPNTTIRQTLHMSIGGPQIRIRFSNAFGVNDLSITHATVAIPLKYNNSAANPPNTGSPSIDTSTLQQLTFSGSKNFTIPDGALAFSDPLHFPVQALSEIAVTIYLADGQASSFITSHPGSRVDSWISFGDQTTARNITGPSTINLQHWYFVSAVEVWAPSDASAFVVVGDSITDGRGSDTDGNDRWPDLVLARMQQNPSTRNIAVVNQAAGGNRVLYDGLGPNALGRIDRDVLSQSGVKYAMIFEGVNDIGTFPADNATQQWVGTRLITAFQQIVTRVHTFGIPIFAATITPFSGNVSIQPYSNPVREATRQRVNNWIRTSGVFDSVIDFDHILADPNNPSQLDPAVNSGDFLHPNETGYHRVANAFPLDIFARFAGGVSTYQ